MKTTVFEVAPDMQDVYPQCISESKSSNHTQAALWAIIALALVLLDGSATETAGPTLASNEGRVKLLASMGWEVTATPKETGQVRIPDNADEVFTRYNMLQKKHGYDLSAFAGKTVMRYVYQINNFPDATDPVYATLLIYKDQVIGGDITDTSAKGVIRGLLSKSTVS